MTVQTTALLFVLFQFFSLKGEGANTERVDCVLGTCNLMHSSQ